MILYLHGTTGTRYLFKIPYVDAGLRPVKFTDNMSFSLHISAMDGLTS